MRPEDDKEMHTSESQPVDNNTASAGASTYPLETLMALQKLLEDGIPDQVPHATQQSHPPLPASATARQPRPATLDQSHGKFTDKVRDWAGRLRSLLMRDKKSATSGKGNSAQQRG